mmetsp:Transcript_8487/g.29179  ORF Transcript_8487/g.29179 Transcript_8487/m.29179 type:complete len:236 (-) Transcript_8487:248-955(-)
MESRAHFDLRPRRLRLGRNKRRAQPRLQPRQERRQRGRLDAEEELELVQLGQRLWLVEVAEAAEDFRRESLEEFLVDDARGGKGPGRVCEVLRFEVSHDPRRRRRDGPAQRGVAVVEASVGRKGPGHVRESLGGKFGDARRNVGGDGFKERRRAQPDSRKGPRRVRQLLRLEALEAPRLRDGSRDGARHGRVALRQRRKGPGRTARRRVRRGGGESFAVGKGVAGLLGRSESRSR